MKKFLTAGASPLRHLSMAALLLVSTVVGVSAHAQAEAADSTEATIKKLIEPRLGKDAKVDAVTKTP
ncbi:MAG TPA: DsbC family protein, partial [Noviherbaspirillum sp.]